MPRSDEKTYRFVLCRICESSTRDFQGLEMYEKFPLTLQSLVCIAQSSLQGSSSLEVWVRHSAHWRKRKHIRRYSHAVDKRLPIMYLCLENLGGQICAWDFLKSICVRFHFSGSLRVQNLSSNSQPCPSEWLWVERERTTIRKTRLIHLGLLRRRRHANSSAGDRTLRGHRDHSATLVGQLWAVAWRNSWSLAQIELCHVLAANCLGHSVIRLMIPRLMRWSIFFT